MSLRLQSEADGQTVLDNISSLPGGTAVAISIRKGSYVSDPLFRALSAIGAVQVTQLTAPTTSLYLVCGFKGWAPGTARETITGTSVIMNLSPDCTIPNQLSVSLVNNSSARVIINGWPFEFVYKLGLNVFVVLKDSLEVVSNINFNTTAVDNATRMDENNKFIQHIKSQSQDGSTLVIVMANVNDGQPLGLTKQSVDVINNTLGSQYLNQFIDQSDQNKWYMISSNGRSCCESSAGTNIVCQGVYYPPMTTFPSTSVSVGSCSRANGKNGCRTTINGVPVSAMAGNTSPDVVLVMTIVDESLRVVLDHFQIVFDTSTPNGPNQITQSDAADYILFNVSVGSLVIVCSAPCPTSYDSLNPKLIEAYRGIGSNLIKNLKNNGSYVIAGRKGSTPGSVPELLSFRGPVSLFTYFASKDYSVKPFVEARVESSGRKSPTDNSGFTKLYFNSREVVPFTYRSGLNVMIINIITGEIEIVASFATGSSVDESNRMETFINSIEAGKLVAIGSCNDWVQCMTVTLRTALNYRLGGITYGYPIQKGSSYSIIGIASPIGQQNMSTPAQSYSAGDTIENSVAISSIRMPVRQLYSPTQLYSSLTVTTNGITVDGNPVGTMIDNIKVYPVPGTYSIDQVKKVKSFKVTGTGDNFYDLIYNLPVGAVVIISITNQLELTEKLCEAFIMLGLSMFKEAMKAVSPYYFATGTKGSGIGTGHEVISKDEQPSVVSNSTMIPTGALPPTTQPPSPTQFQVDVFRNQLLYLSGDSSPNRVHGFSPKMLTNLVSSAGALTPPMSGITVITLRALIIGLQYLGTGEDVLAGAADVLTNHVTGIYHYLNAVALSLMQERNDLVVYVRVTQLIEEETTTTDQMPLSVNVNRELNSRSLYQRTGDVNYTFFLCHGADNHGQYAFELLDRPMFGTEVQQLITLDPSINNTVLINSCNAGLFFDNNAQFQPCFGLPVCQANSLTTIEPIAYLNGPLLNPQFNYNTTVQHLSIPFQENNNEPIVIEGEDEIYIFGQPHLIPFQGRDGWSFFLAPVHIPNPINKNQDRIE
ncbi:hypothetical protein SAMD00019534_031420 [Acytostelium subglobosum LB1]|uniref:hypothetical protein n=1 Tax=Acytostelium subglobosum LB1 TaxID=1410327 RepID=UPI0006449FC6|nr:hypothetical protein SAMD00019534_031420 [Acytostelium subglobosum LB1]GAM19967.1 hypothetical protein SAMD00019534_031420 [Acytostelium subglobosum LB1]|eukprot:XP_012756729.1 hypothetical protein SAMD00019534_031420 [Acytostelium subglobosum LB1]